MTNRQLDNFRKDYGLPSDLDTFRAFCEGVKDGSVRDMFRLKFWRCEEREEALQEEAGEF